MPHLMNADLSEIKFLSVPVSMAITATSLEDSCRKDEENVMRNDDEKVTRTAVQKFIRKDELRTVYCSSVLHNMV
jgi:hypothetical protein